MSQFAAMGGLSVRPDPYALNQGLASGLNFAQVVALNQARRQQQEQRANEFEWEQQRWAQQQLARSSAQDFLTQQYEQLNPAPPIPSGAGDPLGPPAPGSPPDAGLERNRQYGESLSMFRSMDPSLQAGVVDSMRKQQLKAEDDELRRELARQRRADLYTKGEWVRQRLGDDAADEFLVLNGLTPGRYDLEGPETDISSQSSIALRGRMEPPNAGKPSTLQSDVAIELAQARVYAAKAALENAPKNVLGIVDEGVLQQLNEEYTKAGAQLAAAQIAKHYEQNGQQIPPEYAKQAGIGFVGGQAGSFDRPVGSGDGSGADFVAQQRAKYGDAMGPSWDDNYDLSVENQAGDLEPHPQTNTTDGLPFYARAGSAMGSIAGNAGALSNVGGSMMGAMGSMFGLGGGGQPQQAQPQLQEVGPGIASYMQPPAFQGFGQRQPTGQYVDPQTQALVAAQGRVTGPQSGQMGQDQVLLATKQQIIAQVLSEFPGADNTVIEQIVRQRLAQMGY